MILNKALKEDIKRGLIIAYNIDQNYYNKKVRQLFELRNNIFDLTNCNYKKIDKEITEILQAACNEITASQEKTA